MESSQHNIATEEIVNMADLEKVGLWFTNMQHSEVSIRVVGPAH